MTMDDVNSKLGDAICEVVLNLGKSELRRLQRTMKFRGIFNSVWAAFRRIN